MTDHLARPGPAYWDWRCLECGEDVDMHTRWWQFVWRWVRNSDE